MSSDTLSEVLTAVRLKGAVFFIIQGRSPWVAEAPAGEAVAASVLPGSEHIIQFHAVTDGNCWAGLIDNEPVRLEAGDVIVLPSRRLTRGVERTGSCVPNPNWEAHRRAPAAQLPFLYTCGGRGNDEGASHLWLFGM